MGDKVCVSVSCKLNPSPYYPSAYLFLFIYVTLYKFLGAGDQRNRCIMQAKSQSLLPNIFFQLCLVNFSWFVPHYFSSSLFKHGARGEHVDVIRLLVSNGESSRKANMYGKVWLLKEFWSYLFFGPQQLLIWFLSDPNCY